MSPHTSRPPTICKKMQGCPLTQNQRSLIGRLLDLNEIQLEKIEITDEISPLILVHYREGTDVSDPAVASVRGTIIDTEREYVVVRGGYHVPFVVVDSLDTRGDGELQLTDTDGKVHNYQVKADDFTITPFLTGVNVRCFLHRGQAYCSTYRRLNPRARRSRWADHCETFMSMYDAAGGPSLDSLFPTNPQESPYVYRFHIFHPSLNLPIMLETPREGFLRYDGMDTMWTPETSPYPELRGKETSPPVVVQLGKSIFEPRWLTLEEANEHLRVGYTREEDREYLATLDVRLGGGESLIVGSTNQEGRLDLIHVKSKAYNFRESLGDDESNRYMAFIHSTSLANIDVSDPDAYKLFTTIMPALVVPSDDEIDTSLTTTGRLPPVRDLSKEDFARQDRYASLRMIWYIWLVNATQYYRPMVRRFLQRYDTDCDSLILWIRSLLARYDPELNVENSAEKRVVQIINHTHRLALKARSAKTDFTVGTDGRKRTISTLDLRLAAVPSIVAEEDTESLHRLIRLMHRRCGTSSLHITEPEANIKVEGHFPLSVGQRVEVVPGVRDSPTLPRNVQSGVGGKSTSPPQRKEAPKVIVGETPSTSSRRRRRQTGK